MPAASPVEPFRPSSGQAVGWAGLVLLCGAAVWAVLDDPGLPSMRVALGMLLAAAVVWVTMLRPRAAVHHDRGVLVLRNPLSDTYVPLALIDHVSVRQTLDVQVEDHRYLCIGIGRSARDALRRRRDPAGQPEPRPGHPAPAPGEPYGEYVARRIGMLAREARVAARQGTGDPGGPPLAVRRAWALPEVVALAVLGVAFVAALLG